MLATRPDRIALISRGLSVLSQYAAWWLTAVCLLLATALAARSTRNHLADDVGFFHYLAWLMNERGYIPYIDIHETSFPGSFFLYGLLAWLGQYSSAGFHWVNIASALLCAALLIHILRHFHWRAAAVGSALFLFWYFAQPPALYLQRDFLVIPFILGAIAMLLAPPAIWRAAGAGALFACAASIKPHAAIGAPLVILLLAQGTPFSAPPRTTFIVQAVLASLTGFVTVCCGMALWLHTHGNLQPFLRMVTEYLPLYQRMNGIHLAQTAAQQWHNAFTWVSGTATLLGAPVALVLLCVWRTATVTRVQQRLALLLSGLWLLYLVYVGIGGKFWDYHVMPANVFYCALLGLSFTPWNGQTTWALCLRSTTLMVTAFWLWAVYPWADSVEQARCTVSHTASDTCAVAAQDQYHAEDQLTQYLQQRLRPGERIEPQATSTVGTLFTALMRVHALPATPYLESFPLYHDANTRYVQTIRHDMLSRLQAHPPRFIIRPANFFAPGGDAASRFTALEQFLLQHYSVVQDARLPGPDYFTVLEYHP